MSVVTRPFSFDDFRPKIISRTSSPEALQLDTWEMPRFGMPVTNEVPLKTAVWLGRRLTKYAECPVIVATSQPNKAVFDMDSDWYFGIVHRDELLNTTDSPRLTLLETAVTPAFNAPEAIRSLQLFLPDSAYDPTERILLPPIEELLAS